MIISEGQMEGILEAGVDWLTLTAKPKTSQDTLLEVLSVAVEQVAVEAGGNLKPGRLMGYVGDTTKGYFAGVRKDSRILRCSGIVAKELFTKWRGYGEPIHCTRLDLQVTYIMPEDCPGYAKQVAQELEQAYSAVHESQRSRRTHIDSYGHGDTISISTRSRPVYMRIYDKCRESGGVYPTGSWRFEVELKQDKPDVTLPDLLACEWPDLMTARLVRSYMALKGVTVPWDAEYIKVTSKGVHTPTNTEKRLEWLRQAVRPAIRQMIQDGKLDDVIDALGLTNIE